MVATQEQTHKMLYGAGGGRPARGGTVQLVYIFICSMNMNRSVAKMIQGSI